MKVLVTGGSGFLGRSVVAGLAAAGHEVVSADLRPPAVEMDVTSQSQVDAVIGAERPEVVVHLASIVTPGPGSTRSASSGSRDRPQAGRTWSTTCPRTSRSSRSPTARYGWRRC